ncbi:MAG: ABC transporter substrate-binding protein, partial [Candidatus Adiutrix sp.]|nr:ABC transporter substrate-binding protein [Candidatus Adiutrix sp.]
MMHSPKIFTLWLALILTVMLTAAAPIQAQEKHLRVISLYAAHTEILLRLGARDNLIGLSGQETYAGPETEGWKRPPVFSIRDDVEKFLAAKPDYILVRPMHMASGSRLMETLKRSGVKVYAAQVVHADDLYTYWRDLAA